MVNGKDAQNSVKPSCTFASRPETCGTDLVVQGINKAVEGSFVF